MRGLARNFKAYGSHRGQLLVQLPVELDPLLVAYHQVMLGKSIVGEYLLGLANCEAQLKPRATSDEARVEVEELSIASSTLEELHSVTPSQRVEETAGFKSVLWNDGAPEGIPNGGELVEVATQEELHAGETELRELQPKAHVKFTNLVDPEAIAAGGSVDDVASDPVVGSDSSCSVAGDMGLRDDVNPLSAGTQALYNTLQVGRLTSAGDSNAEEALTLKHQSLCLVGG